MITHLPRVTLVALCAVLVSAFPAAAGVEALFDMQSVSTGPFPSDRFTVSDDTQNTRLRVNLPKPDCAVRVSDCLDIDLLNELDGFNVQPRVSIPFSGPIDIRTVNEQSVFLLALGNSTPGRDEDDEGDDQECRSGHVLVGLNELVWDVETNTLHGIANEMLEQHAHYALIVTRGVRDAAGHAVEASAAFARFRHDLNFGHIKDPRLKVYRTELVHALARAADAGIRRSEIVTASVFTTQSVTASLEKIRDQIKAGAPDPADFLSPRRNLGPSFRRRRRGHHRSESGGNGAALQLRRATTAVAQGLARSPQHRRNDRLRKIQIPDLYPYPGERHAAGRDTDGNPSSARDG
jgi:hypothetical protein